MSATDENASTQWDELVKVGEYPTLEQAQEHGLVILAMQEPCWVAEAEPAGEFSLHAEPQSVAEISQELRTYDSEQQQPVLVPTTDHEVFRYPPGWDVYALWMISLVLTFIWQGEHPSLVERAASSSTGLIDRGEWWRPFTGLFLHADFPHLVGNLLSGLFFGTLVARSVGPWRAWLLILVCGTLGNALTSVFTYPESFVSIGASTAVFGALGILSGIGFAAMLRDRMRLPWAKITAPLIAGIILLGWLGGGSHGGNTDVLGHVFGFCTGLTTGLLIGLLTPAKTPTIQHPS
ncbi:MAG: rhomboid family intramembrane serine protease [Verrucomicrobia bacterium]|nr:rhomboid family intramembrane serine protease [Verrucomicrobiota bacterium]